MRLKHKLKYANENKSNIVSYYQNYQKKNGVKFDRTNR